MIKIDQFHEFMDCVDNALSTAEERVAIVSTKIESNHDNTKFYISYLNYNVQAEEEVNYIFANHGLPRLDDPGAPWGNYGYYTEMLNGGRHYITRRRYEFGQQDVNDDHIEDMQCIQKGLHASREYAEAGVVVHLAVINNDRIGVQCGVGHNSELMNPHKEYVNCPDCLRQ